MNDPADAVRIIERLHSLDNTLTRMTIEISNLTTKVGTQNGRIGKMEEQITNQRIGEAVALAQTVTRKEVEGSFRKRDLAALATVWGVIVIIAEMLGREALSRW